MTTFLFWNLRGNDRESWPARAPNLAASLGRLVYGVEQKHPVDVVMLAECGFTPAEAVAALRNGFVCHSGLRDRVQVFARIGLRVVRVLDDELGRRLTVEQVTTGRGMTVLLTCVHLPSAPHYDLAARTDAAREAAVLVAEAERRAEHRRTLVVGDLNMDPYDPGLTSPDGFHAVMDRAVATRGSRGVRGRARPYFYNPMWGLFGDRTPGPAGTYHYLGTSAHVGWHLFDQVLLRPDLMDTLWDLRILDRDGRDSLVTPAGRPDAARRSDHLPILFRLDI